MHPATIAGFLDEFTSQMVKVARLPSRLRGIPLTEFPEAMKSRGLAHRAGRESAFVRRDVEGLLNNKLDLLRKHPEAAAFGKEIDKPVELARREALGLTQKGRFQRALGRRAMESVQKTAALMPSQLAGLPSSSPLVRSTLKRFGKKTYDVSHLMNKPTKKGADVMELIKGFRG
jgi:hypothetical protein